MCVGERGEGGREGKRGEGRERGGREGEVRGEGGKGEEGRGEGGRGKGEGRERGGREGRERGGREWEGRGHHIIHPTLINTPILIAAPTVIDTTYLH